MSAARETVDTSVRILSGEQVSNQSMDLGGMDSDLSAEPAPELGASDLDSDEMGDGFDATSSAVGGEEELGRERR